MWIFRIHFKIAPELCHIKNDETSKKIESITIKSKKKMKKEKMIAIADKTAVNPSMSISMNPQLESI